MKRRVEDKENILAPSIDEDLFYDNIFFRTNLIFTSNEQKKLRNSSVAIIGLGGIGGISAEMIVRCGVGKIGLSDIDYYEPTNLNRQLFSSFHNSYGPNRRHKDKKAHVAEERIKRINPFCKVEVIADGINNQNVEEFCKKYDLIVAQPDRESVKVLIHRIAKKYSIPVITSSRANYSGNRWTITSKFWDYKNNQDLKTFEETNHPSLLKYSLEELTKEVLDEYDRQDKMKVKNKWKEIIENNECKKYGLIDKKHALKVMDKHPEVFHKCHIIAPIANIAGAMGSIKTIKFLLGYQAKPFAFDFWNGEVYELQN